MMKKLISLVCALALTLTLALPTALAAGPNDPGWDFVVLIDRSGSMTGGAAGNRPTDPTGIALEAANMLIDRASAENTSVAVLIFGYGIVMDSNDISPSTQGFVDLSNEALVKELKDRISNCPADNSDDTNTGAALSKAQRMIGARRAQYPNHSFKIILLSDGAVDIGDSKGFTGEYGYSNKNSAEAQRKAEELTRGSIDQGYNVASSCAQDGVTISCIGIYNDNPDVLGSDMENWVKTTGGEYVPINNVDDAYAAVRDIIVPDADINAVIDGRFHVEPGALEANIEIIPGVEEDRIHLVMLDANGNEIPGSRNNINSQVRTGSDNRYSILKLYRPIEGDYQLSFDGVNIQELNITLTYNRNLELQLSVPSTLSNGETTNDIVLRVTRQNSPFELTQPPQIVVTRPDGTPQMISSVQWDDVNQYYVGTWTPNAKGEYTMRASAEYDGLTTLSNEVFLKVGDAKISVSQDLPTVTFDGKSVTKYTSVGSAGEPGYDPQTIGGLNVDYFKDPDNVGIQGYQADFITPGGEEYVDIAIDNLAHSLTLTPKKGTNGTVEFAVRAMGMDGSISPALKGSVVINDAQAPVRMDGSPEARFQNVVEITTDPTHQNPDGSNVTKVIVEIKSLLPQKTGTVIADNVAFCFREPNDGEGEGFEVDTIPIVVEDEDSQRFGAVDATEAVIERGITPNPQTGVNELSVRALKEGEESFFLRARSYDGSTADIVVTVRVVNMLKTYLIYAGIALAAILLLVVLICVLREAAKPKFEKNSHLAATLVRNDDSGEDESEGSCPLVRYGKKKVKMAELLRRCGISTNGLRKYLENMEVSPRKGGGILISMKNKGKKDTRTLSANGTTEINLDSTGDRVLTVTYIVEGMDDYD